MKTTPFLDFYKKAISEGSIKSQRTAWAEQIGIGGLCHTTIAHTEQFKLMEIGPLYYWGYDPDYSGSLNESDEVRYAFTPLRQTIVLFCAAINNEL